MKHLVLFELGKKHYYSEFESYAMAVETINACTNMAYAAIESIDQLEDRKFRVVFIDETPAILRIIEGDVAPLGYNAADLKLVFAKLNQILLSKNINISVTNTQEETPIFAKKPKTPKAPKTSKAPKAPKNPQITLAEKKLKKQARNDAMGIVLAGLATILVGFAVSALLLEPLGGAWQYSIFGAIVLLGLAITIRGSYIAINPKKLIAKKQTKNYAKMQARLAK